MNAPATRYLGAEEAFAAERFAAALQRVLQARESALCEAVAEYDAALDALTAIADRSRADHARAAADAAIEQTASRMRGTLRLFGCEKVEAQR